MFKKDFEAFTNYKALKQNAVELCGVEFITKLTSEGLFAKDDEFWERVNKKLNVPDNYCEQLRIQEQEERERLEREKREKLEAEIAKYNNELERLHKNKKLIKTVVQEQWTIEIFQVPTSEIFKGNFLAIASRLDNEIVSTKFAKSIEQTHDFVL